jgi:subtilisin family serine protease
MKNDLPTISDEVKKLNLYNQLITQIKIKDDIQKIIANTGLATDVEVSKCYKKKICKVKFNNNKSFNLDFKMFSKNQVNSQHQKSKWIKYVKKIINKQLRKNTNTKDYLIYVNNEDGLLDIPPDVQFDVVKKVQLFGICVVKAYATEKDIVRIVKYNQGAVISYSRELSVNVDPNDIPETNYDDVVTPLFFGDWIRGLDRLFRGDPAPPQPQIVTLGPEIVRTIQNNVIDPISTVINSADNFFNPVQFSPFLNIIGWNQSSRSRSNTFNLVNESNGIFNERVIYVFVFDTGINQHVRLNVNGFRSMSLTPGERWWDDEQTSHGTHVAGIISQVTSRGGGSWFPSQPPADFGVQVIAVKVLRNNGTGGNSLWIMEGIKRVSAFKRDNPRANIVVNLSLAGERYRNGESGQRDEGYEAVFTSLVREGVVVIAAAGNTRVDASSVVPGAVDDVICVGALNTNGNGYWLDSNNRGTNRGARLDIMAPGERIVSTVLTNASRDMSGTSMATPIVSGYAVLWIANAINSGRIQPGDRDIPRLLRSDLIRDATRVNNVSRRCVNFSQV